MSGYNYINLVSRTEAGGGGIQQKNKKCEKAVALHNQGAQPGLGRSMLVNLLHFIIMNNKTVLLLL